MYTPNISIASRQREIEEEEVVLGAEGGGLYSGGGNVSNPYSDNETRVQILVSFTAQSV